MNVFGNFTHYLKKHVHVFDYYVNVFENYVHVFAKREDLPLINVYICRNNVYKKSTLLGCFNILDRYKINELCFC